MSNSIHKTTNLFNKYSIIVIYLLKSLFMSINKGEYIKKTEIEELVDSDGGIISGDRNVTSNSEIETGPVQAPFNDNSDYEKNTSTTTDRATRYRQDLPWFASYGHTNRVRNVSENKKMKKSDFETKIIEDIVKKSNFDGELFDKTSSPSINKIINKIESTDLTKNQLEKIKELVLKLLKNKDV